MKKSIVLLIVSILLIVLILSIGHEVQAATAPKLTSFGYITLATWDSPPAGTKDHVTTGIVYVRDVTSNNHLQITLMQSQMCNDTESCRWYGYFFPEDNHDYEVENAELCDDRNTDCTPIYVEPYASKFSVYKMYISNLLGG